MFFGEEQNFFICFKIEIGLWSEAWDVPGPIARFQRQIEVEIIRTIKAVSVTMNIFKEFLAICRITKETGS